MVITITLRQIKSNCPDKEMWKKLLKLNGSIEVDFDRPLPLSSVLDAGSLVSTIGCFHCLPEHKDVLMEFALFCAKRASVGTANKRVPACITAMEEYIKGNADAEQVASAAKDARDDTCRGTTAVTAVAAYILAFKDGRGTYATSVAYAASVAAHAAYATQLQIADTYAYDSSNFMFSTLGAHAARSREEQRQVDYLRMLLDGEEYGKPEGLPVQWRSRLWALITKSFKKWKNKVQ